MTKETESAASLHLAFENAFPPARRPAPWFYPSPSFPIWLKR